MTRLRQLLLAISFFTFCVPQTLDAQEWTRFRGPNGTGISDTDSIPTKWTEADYNWKIDLPGVGHASPVLWGEKIFIHSSDPETASRTIMCLHASDGKILWSKSFPSKIAEGYRVREQNSLASSTPVVDAERVYTVWSQGDSTTLKVLTHDGEFVWERELGPYLSGHGFCTSPILVENLLIMQMHQRIPRDNDPADATESYVVAFDRKTGEIAWKTPRENAQQAAHAVPFLYQPPGEPLELVINSRAHGITGFDPHTGEVKWSLEVFDKRPVSSPILASGLIFGTSGSGGGGNKVVALRPGPNPEVVYEIKTNAPYVPSLIAKDDLVFLWYDRGGIVTCIDAASGNVHWKKRVGGDYFSSPVLIGDRIFCTDIGGTTVVLAASKDYKLLAKNDLGDNMHATPAIAGGRLYLRTFHHLISLGGKK